MTDKLKEIEDAIEWEGDPKEELEAILYGSDNIEHDYTVFMKRHSEKILKALTNQVKTDATGGVDVDRFVKQTCFGESGNCMSACLATIMGLSIDDVPNFFEVSNTHDEWWKAVHDWLETYGYGLCTVDFSAEWMARKRGYVIVSGVSERDLFHATIWKDGEFVHDPFPNGKGVENPEQVDFLYKLDPSIQQPTIPPETIEQVYGALGGMLHEYAKLARYGSKNIANGANPNKARAEKSLDLLKPYRGK